MDDDAASLDRLRQRFLIEEIRPSRFRAQRTDGPLGGIRPNEPEGHVTSRDELADDPTAEDTGRPRDEDPHPIEMSLKRLNPSTPKIFLSRGKLSGQRRGPSRAGIR